MEKCQAKDKKQSQQENDCSFPLHLDLGHIYAKTLHLIEKKIGNLLKCDFFFFFFFTILSNKTNQVENNSVATAKYLKHLLQYLTLEVCIYIYTFFFCIFSHHDLSQNTEYSSLCYVVEPCYPSILSVIVCIY